ncbi:MAG: hypothetical protein GY811_28730 [Myxococcales bacterium]|nr:hypothetical protein [Myxococcales bacterium]
MPGLLDAAMPDPEARKYHRKAKNPVVVASAYSDIVASTVCVGWGGVGGSCA